MNPCAGSFTPKLTYADTVKASLPRPNGNINGKSPPTRQGEGPSSRPGRARQGAADSVIRRNTIPQPRTERRI
ncbi:hypothetical protein ACRE_024360 [Hapsidospora chrysogenum ATCC 11550]|uniref:Uncharacterized protein n=1 Tax=Hapsidospora chrysogenum (strain ATCC 11550 / CBS 779.69 / DSM 880 / IAM 14645 / JCM 23072 / IMI 49137) TaxID=857340 RepID=A0A086TBH2_HAPC1|nr:hypothetical protein ACRE_024360 [Hapsidospora chrysogenum ATCC 11550]